MFGAYFGAFAALGILVRALFELPGKLKGVSFDPIDFAIGLSGTALVLAAIVLLGAGLGWLVGRLKLNAEERRRAREESLVVRR